MNNHLYIVVMHLAFVSIWIQLALCPRLVSVSQESGIL